MPKKKTDNSDPDLHKEIKEFDIKINEFGEITTNLNIDKLNAFLNENVEDKKLNELKEKEEQEKDPKE